jgi:hypothetical protein
VGRCLAMCGLCDFAHLLAIMYSYLRITVVLELITRRVVELNLCSPLYLHGVMLNEKAQGQLYLTVRFISVFCEMYSLSRHV